MGSDLNQQYLTSLTAMMEQSDKLSRLTNPLYKHFGINGFRHAVVYETGEVLHLGSNKAFFESFFLGRIANNNRFSVINHLSLYPQAGYYLVDIEDTIRKKRDPFFNELLSTYDTHHDFIMLNRIQTSRGQALAFFFYHAPLHQADINRFYINNLELLMRFNRHVTREFEDTIQSLPLIQPTHKEKKLARVHLQRLMPQQTQQKAFVKETKMPYPKYSELAHIKISNRQKEIIHWYLLGKSEPDTAAILNVSVDTIHDHFKRLKLKFNCYSKSQLLLKLIDSGLLTANDWEAIYADGS